MQTRNGDEQPREEAPELGWKGSFVLGCGIAVVALVLVGLVVAWRGKKAEAEKRSHTDGILRNVYTFAKFQNAPKADGRTADWTGQKMLGLPEIEVDGWGNPVHYRCPGPVHKNGFDVWSCGPNGKDDQGTFDDILVGEDVAPVSSR